MAGKSKTIKRGSVAFPDVVILGVDTAHKIGDHVLVGEREIALNPEKPNPGLVASIRKFGFDESKPIKLRQEKVSLTIDGEEVEKKVSVVVDGRNRVLAIRFLNKEIANEAEHFLPFLITDAVDENDGDKMVVLNSARTQDNTMTRARRAARLINVNGREKEEVATIEGVDVATVRRWLKLVTMPKATQKAVEQGKLSANVALKVLGKLKDTDEKNEHSDALKTLLDDHAQTKLAPSLARAEHLLNGGTTAAAPTRAAKPKVGPRHIKAIGRFYDAGSLELSDEMASFIAVLTDPEASPEGGIKAILDRVTDLEADEKKVADAAKKVDRDAAAEKRKAEKDVERAATKAKKEREKAAKAAQKLKDKADKAKAANEAAQKALKDAAAAADLDPESLGITTGDDGSTSAEGSLSI